MNSRNIVRSLFIGAISAAACKGGGEPQPPPIAGPPSQIVVTSGSSQAAFANLELASAINVSVQDANGMGVAGQLVTFGVAAGGGSLSGNTTPTTDANGSVTAPSWRLGKSVLPQVLRATFSPTIVKDINATVQSNYTIVVRFYGPSMTGAQQALFTTAAARIMGIVTGDVSDLAAQPVDLAPCQVTGQTLNEPIDDIILYASAQPIDGAGGVLGRAGPCYIRDPGIATIVGAMQFDSADLDNLITLGLAQDVITHEMLHVLGIGTLWTQTSVNLLSGADTDDPRFSGAQGRQGCQNQGGTITCATSVPVENTGGTGTKNSHWRDFTFGNELMTGFINNGVNPLSSLTLRSLADLGYTVNTADFDTYTIPGGQLRAAGTSASIATSGQWEELNHTSLYKIDHAGRVRLVRERQ